MENQLPLEKEISGILGKLPAFPDNVKEIIVKISPYLCMIGVFFGALGLLAAFGIGLGMSGIGVSGIGGAAYGGTTIYYISMVILAIQVFLEATAIRPLMNRQKKGWDNLYYVYLLSIVNVAISFFGSYTTLVSVLFSLVLTFGIGGWILFQTKEKYS
jgi:hypothetical protein